MAKVQGKKAASTAKKAAVKAAPVKAAAKKKSAAKPAAKPAPKPKAKAAPKAKAVAKKVVKTAAKATKKAAKAVAKSKPVAKAKAVAKAVKKPVAKAAAKVVAKAKAAPKAVTKSAAKPAAKPAPKVVAKPTPKAAPAPKAAVKPAPKVVAAPAAAPKPVAAKVDDKKRIRRPRSRITSSGTAVATWFTQGDKPRSSSFIPAPPRAEAPSLIAAPPASSDRLVSHAELTEFVVRTVPVRVDIEQGAGRIYLNINPLEVVLRAGEGIEWDFRYLGGADVVVEDIIIEFEKPAPFAAAPFRSKRPGANRPHRQLSGPVVAASIGKRTNYSIRALNMFKTELAVARLSINILP